MWHIRRGKGEAHIKSYKYHFVFPSFFSSPSSPLLLLTSYFFSVADGGGKIPGGQDKLLNIVISNGSSWKLLTDAAPEIRTAEAASVRLGASHWFPFLIVKSKSMVTLQADYVPLFWKFLLVPSSSLFSPIPFSTSPDFTLYSPFHNFSS